MRLVSSKTLIALALLAVSNIAVSSRAVADTSGTSDDSQTLMADRGKLLLGDDFSSLPAKPWTMAKGRWEIVDGALQGAEIKSQMHGAVMRHPLAFDNAVIQYSFKLDGSKMTSFSINDPKGHNCRVTIGPNGFAVRKDDHDHAGPDKAVLLQNRAVKIEPGTWHTITIELLGPALLAQLDGGPVAFGENPALDVKKSNIGLTVAGESASFKQLHIWEAKPRADWPAAKARLLSANTDAKTSAK
ncbi:MAG TPA: hypothetical protein VIK18_18285 [Pirellulales bacterium]